MSEPPTVSEDGNRTSPIDRYLESMLLRRRGNNGPLAREVLSCLSPEARMRLYRLLQDFEQDVANEHRKAYRSPWRR